MSYKKNCLYCNEEFTAQRNTGKFCKPAHRAAYNRLETRVHNMLNAAIYRIYDLADLAREHPHIAPDVDIALKDIAKFAKRKLVDKP